MTPESEPVVTVNVTVMDGMVVRWYRDLKDYEVSEPALSASRNRWQVHGGKVPPEWLQAAREVHAALRDDSYADVSHLATHRIVGGRRGLLIPIRREEK